MSINVLNPTTDGYTCHETEQIDLGKDLPNPDPLALWWCACPCTYRAWVQVSCSYSESGLVAPHFENRY